MNGNVSILFVQFVRGVMRCKIFSNWLHWVKFYGCSAGAREVECLHILTGLEKLHLGGECWRAVSGESGPADHVEG